MYALKKNLGRTASSKFQPIAPLIIRRYDGRLYMICPAQMQDSRSPVIDQNYPEHKNHPGSTGTWKLFSVCDDALPCRGNNFLLSDFQQGLCTNCVLYSAVMFFQFSLLLSVSDIVGVVTRLTDLIPWKTNQEPKKRYTSSSIVYCNPNYIVALINKSGHHLECKQHEKEDLPRNFSQINNKASFTRLIV
jgi:hypothetical protein